jgi:DNA-binding response OmpR family regulator
MRQIDGDLSIVMIEDDSGHARLIEKNIRRAGVNNEIIGFDNGEAALRHLLDDRRAGPGEGRRRHLVLLDLNLPDMTGVEILRRLKTTARTKHLPVIVLTTTDDRHEIERCYDLGANVYIIKPLNYDNFTDAIRQLGLFIAFIEIPDVH